jgi:hypothetical protein
MGAPWRRAPQAIEASGAGSGLDRRAAELGARRRGRDAADRIAVMRSGRLVGTRRAREVTHDEVLGLILGALRVDPTPGPGVRA